MAASGRRLISNQIVIAIPQQIYDCFLLLWGIMGRLGCLVLFSRFPKRGDAFQYGAMRRQWSAAMGRFNQPQQSGR
jgi:hypothetical protein